MPAGHLPTAGDIGSGFCVFKPPANCETCRKNAVVRPPNQWSASSSHLMHGAIAEACRQSGVFVACPGRCSRFAQPAVAQRKGHEGWRPVDQRNVEPRCQLAQLAGHAQAAPATADDDDAPARSQGWARQGEQTGGQEKTVRQWAGDGWNTGGRRATSISPPQACLEQGLAQEIAPLTGNAVPRSDRAAPPCAPGTSRRRCRRRPPPRRRREPRCPR